MRLLVLGGTAWLGREVASHAVARGHEVVCLARGVAGEVADGARFVRADRDQADALEAVAAGRWDAVVDLARQPGHVRRAVATLQEVARRYLFVSSISVYADHREPGQDESADLLPAFGPDGYDDPEHYGAAKVACEQAVLGAFGPQRALIARAGLIGGPGDPSGRSCYWPWRFARPSNPAGAVLVPADADQPTALIDARDLAGWLVRAAEQGTTGIFNAAGQQLPLREHLQVARAVAGHRGPLVRASSGWLREHGVHSWAGPTSLPLWLDDPDWRGLSAHDTSRAVAAGLTSRPLARTLADTLAWTLGQPASAPQGAGLTDAEERTLLMAIDGSPARTAPTS